MADGYYPPPMPTPIDYSYASPPNYGDDWNNNKNEDSGSSSSSSDSEDDLKKEYINPDAQISKSTEYHEEKAVSAAGTPQIGDHALVIFHVVSIICCILSLLIWFLEIIPAVMTIVILLKFSEKQKPLVHILCIVDLIITSIVLMIYFFLFMCIVVFTFGLGIIFFFLLIPYVVVIIACCTSLFGTAFMILPGQMQANQTAH